MNAIGRFCKDYVDLVKHEIKFMKTHPVGIIAINVAAVGVVAGAYVYQEKREEKRWEKSIKETEKEINDFFKVMERWDINTNVVDVDYEII